MSEPTFEEEMSPLMEFLMRGTRAQEAVNQILDEIEHCDDEEDELEQDGFAPGYDVTDG